MSENEHEGVHNMQSLICGMVKDQYYHLFSFDGDVVLCICCNEMIA